jgi:hypothetical protein
MTEGSQKQSNFLYSNGSCTLRLLMREKKNGGRSLQGFYETQGMWLIYNYPAVQGLSYSHLMGRGPRDTVRFLGPGMGRSS